MPKETFFNLPEPKRNAFIEEMLKEFSANGYDSASINKVIKKLGIARGSVYQYFEDKLDVWKYLKEHSELTKASYIKSVDRNCYKDFWEYYREIYMRGIRFDLEHPYCSRFLYRVGTKETSEEVKPFLDSWKLKANEMFTQWVEFEKQAGAFNRELSTELIVHFLITMSLSISDLLQNRYKVDFEKNLKEGKPLFAGNADELGKAVGDLIGILKKALT